MARASLVAVTGKVASGEAGGWSARQEPVWCVGSSEVTVSGLF